MQLQVAKQKIREQTYLIEHQGLYIGKLLREVKDLKDNNKREANPVQASLSLPEEPTPSTSKAHMLDILI